VPFVAAWPGKISAGAVSDQLFGLNDIYATVAALTGAQLTPYEAEDSENILPALLGDAGFQRPGFPIMHDDSMVNAIEEIPDGAALAIRSGNYKLILGPALVNKPAQPEGAAGQAIPVAFYDLSVDLGETNNLLNNPAYAGQIEALSRHALSYRNRGFSRSTIQHTYGPMFRTDGGTDLNNGINGALGFEFTVGDAPIALTRLGMWDDDAADFAFQETNVSNPDGDTGGTPDGLARNHWLRLFDKATGQVMASVQITNANSVIEGEFRYTNLAAPLILYAGQEYALTMSTQVGDGDFYHSSIPVSGTSPITSSLVGDFQPRISSADGTYPTLRPGGAPATGDITESIYEERLFLGPTATIVPIPPQFADFNSDGRVDGADFLILQRGIGLSGATRAQGDADGNGLVNGLDLSLWRAVAVTQFGLTVEHLATIPEPSAWAHIGIATLLCQRAGRRVRTTIASRH
jgi:hypothetical protein